MAERLRPVVQATADDARLDEPIYAVNLLTRRRPWAYDVYNLLAYPIAKRFGARPLIKGVRGRRGGDAGDGTETAPPETVLIVSYPDATSFLRMTTNPLFLLVSALRKLGLDDFRFGFTRRFDGGPSHPPSRKSGLMLALFWPPGTDVELAELRQRISAAGSTLVFVGTKKAHMAVKRGDNEPRTTRLAPPLQYEHVAIVTGHERTLTPVAESLPPGATMAAIYDRVL